MKKTSTILLIGGGIAAAYFISKAVSTSTAIKKLQYRNPKIKFTNIGWFTITANVTIDVFNPTSVEIPVDYLSGNIRYQGQNLSAFSVDGKGTNLKIKPQGVTSVTFNVVISNTGALQILFSLINGGFTAVLDVTGIFYGMGADNPFAFSYDVLQQRLIANSAISGKAGVNGIAGVEAKLQFSSNRDMENYFAAKRYKKKLMFSKN